MSDTEADLAGLRAVAEAATPGPWEHAFQSVAVDTGKCGGGGCGLYGHEPGCSLELLAQAADNDCRHIATFDPPTVLGLLDRLEAAEAKMARIEALFAGGSDTPCRTTWRPAFGGQREECVEVPMYDLRAALADPGDERGQ